MRKREIFFCVTDTHPSDSMGANSKILTVIRAWISSCLSEKDDTGLLGILKYVSRLPITKESVTVSKIGVVIRKVFKERSSEIKRLAGEIKDSWYSKIQEETPTSASTPALPSESSKVGKDESKKRERATNPGPSSVNSSSSAKSDVQIMSSKKIKATTNSSAPSGKKSGAVTIIPAAGPEQKKKAATVPSFDIFKTLSAKTDLPKIKKSDKPVERKAEQPDLRTSDVVITSVTPATAPAPFSYRKEK
jgi:hypothetical protein